MEQTIINYLNMVGGVLSYLAQERPQWENEPELSDTVTNVETDYLTVLTDSKLIAGMQTTGLTQIKDITFDLVITKTLKLSRKISAYAKKKGEENLLPLVDHSRSSLQDGAEEAALTRCKAITDVARTRLTKLTTFKVTEAEITADEQLITACEGYLKKRTTTTAERVVTAEEVTALQESLHKNLDILDDMIQGMLENDAIINRYLALRKVNDTGKGKTLKNNKTKTVEPGK